MKGYRRLLLFFFIFAVVFLGIFFILKVNKPGLAGLLVETNPRTEVWVNGQKVGKTPFRGQFPVGEVNVRLTAEDSYLVYEKKVFLTSGTETVIQREAGGSEESSTGLVLTFEKNKVGEAQLAILTEPPSAQVSLDNSPRGYAPIFLNRLTFGDHLIAVSAVGYLTKTVPVKIETGYKLTAEIKLAADINYQKKEIAIPLPTATAKPATWLHILETPNGFLRVRQNPDLESNEVYRVKTGERFLLIEREDGWYKIEYALGKFGWISDRYAAVENPNDQGSPNNNR